MIPLAVDENVNGDVVEGVRLQDPEIDLVTVQEAGLSGILDPDVLEWAASIGRPIITADVNTMPKYIKERIEAGARMPGAFFITKNMSIRQQIDEIIMIARGSIQGEYEHQVHFLPL